MDEQRGRRNASHEVVAFFGPGLHLAPRVHIGPRITVDLHGDLMDLEAPPDAPCIGCGQTPDEGAVVVHPASGQLAVLCVECHRGLPL